LKPGSKQAATSNKFMTLCPVDPLMEVLMGQRQEPAFGDIGLVNKLYCQGLFLVPVSK